mgnify:CR=1 FL=1
MGSHTAVIKGADTHEGGMQLLRTMFIDAKVDSDNFVLFSTSGVHGHYGTIEEIEKDWGKPDSAFDEPADRSTFVTYLIIRPRILTFQYGNAAPASLEDIEFLKTLRANSHSIISTIGLPWKG